MAEFDVGSVCLVPFGGLPIANDEIVPSVTEAPWDQNLGGLLAFWVQSDQDRGSFNQKGDAMKRAPNEIPENARHLLPAGDNGPTGSFEFPNGDLLIVRTTDRGRPQHLYSLERTSGEIVFEDVEKRPGMFRQLHGLLPGAKVVWLKKDPSTFNFSANEIDEDVVTDPVTPAPKKKASKKKSFFKKAESDDA